MADLPPILEFDPDRTALIDPRSEPPIPGAPPAAVACFFPSLISELTAAGQMLRRLPSMGELWKIDYQGEPLAVCLMILFIWMFVVAFASKFFM